MPDPPPGPRAKIARAKKHFADLDDAATRFVGADPKPNTVFTETQPDGKIVWRQRILRPIPDEIPCIVGDFIHNLRSALDILACDLVRHNGTDVQPYHGFPIVDHASKFKGAVNGKVQGASKAAMKAIKRLKPYKGGNDDFWVLHQLDIIDKHKLLLAATTANDDIDLSGMKPRVVSGSVLQDDGVTWEERTFELPPNLQRVESCVEDGGVIFGPMDPLEGDEQMGFSFLIALNEPGLVECETLSELTSKLFDLVEATVASFDSFFA